jgi:hypothetical protein
MEFLEQLDHKAPLVRKVLLALSVLKGLSGKAFGAPQLLM